MSKSVHIKVPQPCNENWHAMTPQEQGRFCGSCQKVVVDFSKMSDKELLNQIAKAAGEPICGRFANDQLNRKIAYAPIKKRLSLAYAWNILLASGLFFESCNNTTLGKIIPPEQQPPVEKVEEMPTIMGDTTVVEDTSVLPSNEEHTGLKISLPSFEIKGDTMYKILEVPENEMTTMGFSVMQNYEGPVTGTDGLPLWLKQDCFNKHK